MVENGNKRPNGIPDIEQRIDNGRVFSVRQLFTGIGSGTSRSVFVENPSDSGVNLLTISPGYNATNKAYVEKIQNASIDTNGTSKTPLNKNLGSTRTALAVAEHSGTYSGGTSRGRTVIGSSAGTSTSGALGEQNLALRIEPGDSIQYQLTSQASGNDMSVVVAWVEEPVTS